MHVWQHCTIPMDTRREKLEALKKEKNAVIMAHYYVPDEVQEIADYIGDSYYLSDMATKVDASVIAVSYTHLTLPTIA